MLSLKNKISPDLKFYLDNRCYKNYRILIKCKNFIDNISKKVTSYKGTLLYTLEYSSTVCAILSASSIYRLIEYPEVEHVAFDEYLFVCGNSICHSNNYSPNSNILELHGDNIGIGIVDTGVYPHRDLISKSNRIYEFHDVLDNLNYPYDDNGHGTCIAGVIAGNGISSNGKYIGVAPSACLYVYKAFDGLGKGYASDILFCIECLIKNSLKQNIRILCLPFEYISYNRLIIDMFDNTFKEAINSNLIPVVPSGSNICKESTIRGIATLESCITVGGIKSVFTCENYKYSSGGPYKHAKKPNIAAACDEIVSLNCNREFISEANSIKLYPTKLKKSYEIYSGSSISCAYISGICSLILQKKPELKFKDIISLFNLCSCKKEFSSKEVGCGLLDTSKLFKIL